MPPFNAFPTQLIMGNDTGAATSFDIDSALVMFTSGDSIGMPHQCIEGLSNQTVNVYVYVTAITGSPTSMTMYIYDCASTGDNPNRPDDDLGALYTSNVVDYSGGAGWKQHTFTGVTFASKRTMWFVLANTTGTPASNFPAVQIRGGLDGVTTVASGIGAPIWGHTMFTNTAGWTANGTTGGGAVAPFVVEYPSGNSYGNPYVTNSVAHASNTNYRGNRFTPTEDINLSGFWGQPDTNFASMHVVQNTTDSLNYTISGDFNATQSGGGTRFPAITLTGGLAWDLLQKAGANDTFGVIYAMGTTPPAAVKNAGGCLRYVDGATLGSLAYDDEKYYAMWVEFSDNPAISSGGGSTGFFIQ